jgi:hypothetical protein
MGDLSVVISSGSEPLPTINRKRAHYYSRRFSHLKRSKFMTSQTPSQTPPLNTSEAGDIFRQFLVLLATPLIWVFSSLGVFLDSARSPSGFSDMTENVLVPQTFAFSIWFPIFIGIMAFGIIQALPSNRTRDVYRQSGWWIAAGLWGVAIWGLVTAFVPDAAVELLATLVFIPTMVCLVFGMIKLWRRRDELSALETWGVLAPVSLIAGWCSIAVFVGLNGLIWKFVEPLGWNITASALSVLGLALWGAIYILRHGAMNKIYAFPIVWGLGFWPFGILGQVLKPILPQRP